MLLSEKNRLDEGELRNLRQEAQKLRTQISQFAIKFKGQYQGLKFEKDVFANRLAKAQETLKSLRDQHRA